MYKEYCVMYDHGFLYQMVAQFTMRTCRVNQDLWKAFGYIKRVVKSIFSEMTYVSNMF